MTPLEHRLLVFLRSQRGRVVDTGTLLQQVWGYAATVRTRALNDTLKRLRPKLESNPSKPTRLVTRYRQGTQLNLPNLEAA